MRLWTRKFLAGLLFLAVYILNARAQPMNETTGERAPLLPYSDHTIFSFIFLLVFLFALSHAGSWVLWKLRHRHDAVEGGCSSKRARRKQPQRR